MGFNIKNNYGPNIDVHDGGVVNLRQDSSGLWHTDDVVEAEIVEEEQPLSNLRLDGEELDNGENDDTNLVEKLKPIFYNNEEDVKLFLKEISGMKPGDITDLVNRWVKDKRISDYGYSRKGCCGKYLTQQGYIPSHVRIGARELINSLFLLLCKVF